MNIQNLRGELPDSVVDTLTPEFLLMAEIDGPFRLSHLLGECAEESGMFSRKTENLNYTDVNRIVAIFRRDMDINHDKAIDAEELTKAAKYVSNPEALANYVYANQNGNGDEASGDGYKYRGEGDLQLTGKGAYMAFQSWLQGKGYDVDIVSNPELVATAPYDLLSAVWFFSKNRLWALCDKGVSVTNILAVGKRVNGGTNGAEKRVMYTQKMYALLTADPA